MALKFYTQSAVRNRKTSCSKPILGVWSVWPLGRSAGLPNGQERRCTTAPNPAVPAATL